jgi:integrase
VAQPLRRQTAHRRHGYAGSIPRAVLRGGPARQNRRDPCEGIKQLYTVDRSEIIWTDADVDQLKTACSIEIANAVDLAAHTGLRQGDLLRLSWSRIGEGAIVMATGKSRGRREAIVPLYDALLDVLARTAKRSTTILTNSRGLPWTRDGFGSSFNKAKIAAGMQARDLHFHDLRGIAATRFYTVGLSNASSPKSWAGKRATSPGSSADISGAQPRPRRSFARSMRPGGEHRLQNHLQNPSARIALSAGAGDGDRTHDIKLGKLAFYH